MTNNRRQFMKWLTSVVPAACSTKLFATGRFLGMLGDAGFQEERKTGSPLAPPRIANGRFQPTWDSLQQYQAPDWFRDAKFGIWAHWSAQCQPEMGDWYARNMYVEGSTDYKFQVAHYGHPSKVGFKDIDNMWRADASGLADVQRAVYLLFYPVEFTAILLAIALKGRVRLEAVLAGILMFICWPGGYA